MAVQRIQCGNLKRVARSNISNPRPQMPGGKHCLHRIESVPPQSRMQREHGLSRPHVKFDYAQSINDAPTAHMLPVLHWFQHLVAFTALE